jgi:hypothetical protein
MTSTTPSAFSTMGGRQRMPSVVPITAPSKTAMA